MLVGIGEAGLVLVMLRAKPVCRHSPPSASLTDFCKKSNYTEIVSFRILLQFVGLEGVHSGEHAGIFDRTPLCLSALLRVLGACL